MEKEYSIDQTTYHNLRKGIYTPVSVELLNDGGDKAQFPWERVWIDRQYDRGTPVYIVIFNSKKESDARAFLNENVARKFLRAFGLAVRQQQGDDVSTFLEIPLNNSVNFKTKTDDFTVTFAETKF